MEQKTHTSFIPKKSLSVSTTGQSGSGMSILFLLALIIFAGVIALAIGVFLYQQFLLQNIEKKKSSLERARDAFEPALIAEISRLDTRIESAQDVMNKHKAASLFFDLLEKSTLANIQFENLNYRVVENDRISVSMRGKALNFSSVALQSDVFGESKFIQEPIFSNMNLNKKGEVIFDFMAFIEPKLILYGNTVQQTQ